MTEQEIQEAEEHENQDTGEEAEIEDADTGEDQPQEQQTQKTENEQRAREKGWVPKDEYSGDPRNWVDYDEFLKPQGQVRRERDDWQRKFQAVERNLEMLNQRTEEIEQRGYERAMAEISAQQRRAVEDGDVESWEKLEKQRQEIKPPEPKKADTGDGQTNPVIDEWISENEWFEADEALRMEAIGIDKRLARKHPAMPVRDRLDRVRAEVIKRNPEDFGIDPETVKPKPQYKRTQKVSGTETRGGNSAGGGGKKGWSDIPAEIRQEAKSIIGDGKVFKNQDEYAKSYFKQYPDG